MSVPYHHEPFDQPTAPTITVRRQWNDWKTAQVRLADLTGLHWDNESGGVRARSPQPFLHGYIYCTDVLSGELSHSCRHGKPPHKVKVCIVKRDNLKDRYAALVARVSADLAKVRK